MPFGEKKLVGQHRAKEMIRQILDSGRLHHAYLLSGNKGVGKLAFALAFAEAVNGISNLSDLGNSAFSKKSGWYSHPDIHVFIPKPSTVGASEISERLALLAKDPYQNIHFADSQNTDGTAAGKNRNSFYPIDYYREHIRPVAYYRPNEGKRTVIILSHIETMRKETANAFLKLLEEPTDRVMFIMTTEQYDSLLPTIASRCQHIHLSPLAIEDIEQALQEQFGISAEDARYAARVSGGNYSATRGMNLEHLKETRDSVVQFLRMSYAQDARALTEHIQQWQSANNVEGLITLTLHAETYLRDILVWRETQNRELLINIDQAESIEKFTSGLPKADIPAMIEQWNEVRPMLRQSVSPKLVFTVLSFRMHQLMRGNPPEIESHENWKHLPALVENT